MNARHYLIDEPVRIRRAPKRAGRYMIALAEEAAHELIGTPHAFHNCRDEIEDAQDNRRFCERFDELAFRCEGCEWVCSVDELNELGSGCYCDQCTAEETEE